MDWILRYRGARKLLIIYYLLIYQVPLILRLRLCEFSIRHGALSRLGYKITELNLNVIATKCLGILKLQSVNRITRTRTKFLRKIPLLQKLTFGSYSIKITE